jgi:RNA polymerase sigma-70 factor, ECF subfamily
MEKRLNKSLRAARIDALYINLRSETRTWATQYSERRDRTFFRVMPEHVAAAGPLGMSQDTSTSSSLLRRAMAREPDAWLRIVTLYTPLVRHWCRQAGIADHDVPDLTQEVMAAVSSSLPSFQTDRQGTSFRAWMRGIARHKLLDYLRERGELADGGTTAQQRLMEVPAPSEELDLSESPDDITATYQRALGLVKNEFEDRTWTAFWRVAVDNHAPADVAAELGITPTAVRQAKSRVLRRLKEELGEVIA